MNKFEPSRRAFECFSELLEENVQRVEADAERCFLDAMRMCESPIEQQMLAALLFIRPFYLAVDTPPGSLVCSGLLLLPQAQVGPYRADIYVEFTPPWIGTKEIGFIVECDGHDFHEKTKEQAASDKARDRYMTSLGHRVFRFAGSEIHRDARGCARQVEEAINAELERLLETLTDHRREMATLDEGTPA